MRIILNGSVDTVKRLRISLGTLVAIEATAGSGTTATAAVEAAFAAISHVDRRMHPHKPDSDLARINRSPLHVPVDVHASICDLLELARRINTLTESVFDPCLPSQPGRLQDIDVGSEQVICHAPIELDFGGFAKGYAVDLAIEALLNSGCTSGLVNAGGDLRVFGPRTDAIFMRGPKGQLINVEINNAALAVSDANSKQHPPEHQGYYRRSPATSPSAPALVATYAAVIANTAVVADALSKCVLLCPPATATRTLRAFNATQLPTPDFRLPSRPR